MLSDKQIDALAQKEWKKCEDEHYADELSEVHKPADSEDCVVCSENHVRRVARVVEASSSKPSKAMVEAAAREMFALDRDDGQMVGNDYDDIGRENEKSYEKRAERVLLAAEKARCEQG